MRVIAGVLLCCVIAAGAGLSAAAAREAALPPLAGLTAQMQMPNMSSGGGSSFSGCPGVDPRASYPTLHGSTEDGTSRPLTVVLSLSNGWALATTPAVQRRFPTYLSLAWAPGSDTNSPATLQWISVSVALEAAGAVPSRIVIYTTDDRRRACPAPLSRVDSPIGEAFALKWRLGSIDNTSRDSGCAFLAISGSAPAYRANLLLSGSAGDGYSDKLPDYACVDGRVVPRLPSFPAGFDREPALDAAASKVARKAVDVSCSSSLESWDQAFDVPGTGTTVVGARHAYFYKGVCDVLRKRLGAGVRRLAEEALVLAHMAEHMRGISDEHAAACAALKDLPLLARQFGIRNRSTVQKFVNFARADQDRAFYKTDPC